MIKISKQLALELILKGKDLGSGLCKLDNKQANMYIREYDKDNYTIVESDNKYYVLESDDEISINTEAKETFEGLSDVLQDIIDILKS